MMLTGRRVEGEEALRMGLCNRLVKPEGEEPTDHGDLRARALTSALSLARDIGAGAPLATKAALRAVAGASEFAEDVAYNSVLGSEDRDRALHHFGKKGSPIVFVGR